MTEEYEVKRKAEYKAESGSKAHDKPSDGESISKPILTESRSVEISSAGQDDTTVLKEECRTDSHSDNSLTNSAKESAGALKDLVMAIASKTRKTALEKTKELKENANDERPELEKEAADIQKLGNLVEAITTKFDETMDDIQKAPYEEHVRLYQGFKKLLAEEINVIDARFAMASRLAFTTDQSEPESNTTGASTA